MVVLTHFPTKKSKTNASQTDDIHTLCKAIVENEVDVVGLILADGRVRDIYPTAI